MKGLLRAAAITSLCVGSLQAQTRVVISDLGPGASGRILRSAVAQPHRLVEPDTGWFMVRREDRFPTTLIVLGRSAAVSGTVEGDVIVVDGDLFVRPGGHIAGRAIAIGGGVYPSALSHVGAGTQSFRDNTFLIARTADGYQLEYHSLREGELPPLLFPGVYGLRFPTYDRVNGLSVPFGPALTLLGGDVELNALITYRSDLGKIDPSIDGTLEMGRRSRATAKLQRGTVSNDAWIWSNWVNSLSAVVWGVDTRNYYRADRADARIYRRWESTTTQIEPFIGGQTERAWSVGPGFDEQRGPWSVFGRTDSLGMRRPNPPVQPGTITSILVGTGLRWDSQQLALRARTHGELSASTPADQRFVQFTTDLEVSYPTFGEQEYAIEVHWVTTTGDTPPPQRFAYFGGSGTLPFLDLLEQGGDQLLLIDQRYSIPVPTVRIGILGTPTFLLRHRLGSAGVGALPSFDQVVGVGVMLTLVRAEVQMDPSRRKARLTFGFSFSR